MWFLLIAGAVYLLAKSQNGAQDLAGDFWSEDPGAVSYEDLIPAEGDDVDTGAVVALIADQVEKREGIIPDASKPLEPKTGLRGSRAYRNNNPGNLRSAGDLGYATKYDETKLSAEKYGCFSSYAAGRAALEADILAKMQGRTRTGLGPGSTLLDLFKVYAPSSDANDPLSYAEDVASGIGAAISTTLGDLLNGTWG